MPTSAASSSAHSNVTPCWSDENSNVAVVDSDGSVGVESRIVSGKAETVHWRVAGDESAPPAMFTARTWSVYTPGSATLTSYGDTQSSYVPPSSEHSNVAVSSVDEKRNSATVLRVDAAGPETIVVSGATTVQLWLAGVPSTMPDVLVATTWSV